MRQAIALGGAVLLLLLGPVTAHATFFGLSVQADTVTKSQFTPGGSVSAASGASTAFADSNTRLGDASVANSSIPGAHSATSTFSSDYRLLGTSGAAPSDLLFNFDFSGNYSIDVPIQGALADASYKYQIAGAVVGFGALSCLNRGPILALGGAPVVCSSIGTAPALGQTNQTTGGETISTSIQRALPDSGLLSLQLQAGASESGGGSAVSDFSHTLVLSSITVPDDFAGDVSGLSVAFDSGFEIPVTRAGTTPPSGTPGGTTPGGGSGPGAGSATPVPEPASFALLGAGLFGLPALRRNSL